MKWLRLLKRDSGASSGRLLIVRAVAGALALLAVAAVVAMVSRQTRSVFSSKFAPQDQRQIVYVRKAEKRPLSDQLLYPARVMPKVNAAVLADTDGVISSIRAPLGSRVKARAVLMTLRNIDPAYQYAPLSVLSPVAGVVGQIEVSEGSRVSRGDRLLVVTDPDRIRVTIEVPAHELKKIKPGLSGELRLPGQDQIISLNVKGISPFVDSATGTAHCELQVDRVPEGVALAPGLVGRVTFKTNPRMGFVVPDSAIAFAGKAAFVRLVVDGKAQKVPATLGRRQGGSTEILTGLTEGAIVIERASGSLANGEDVDPQPIDELKD